MIMVANWYHHFWILFVQGIFVVAQFKPTCPPDQYSIIHIRKIRLLSDCIAPLTATALPAALIQQLEYIVMYYEAIFINYIHHSSWISKYPVKLRAPSLSHLFLKNLAIETLFTQTWWPGNDCIVIDYYQILLQQQCDFL